MSPPTPITAVNYEVGLKGRALDNLLMAVALFYTDYSDLPYQVSTTAGAGFDTRNIIVNQESWGVEWEGSWYAGGGFFLHSSLGYIDVDVDDPVAVAPLTPEWTAAIGPELSQSVGTGGRMSYRARLLASGTRCSASRRPIRAASRASTAAT